MWRTGALFLLDSKEGITSFFAHFVLDWDKWSYYNSAGMNACDTLRPATPPSMLLITCYSWTDFAFSVSCSKHHVSFGSMLSTDCVLQFVFNVLLNRQNLSESSFWITKLYYPRKQSTVVQTIGVMNKTRSHSNVLIKRDLKAATFIVDPSFSSVMHFPLYSMCLLC